MREKKKKNSGSESEGYVVVFVFVFVFTVFMCRAFVKSCFRPGCFLKKGMCVVTKRECLSDRVNGF